MKHQIIIRPEAENDLRESFLWYEEKRQGLGHDFLLQIEAGLKFIQRNPELTPVEYKEARKRIIKKFPYKIIYLCNFCSGSASWQKKSSLIKKQNRLHLTKSRHLTVGFAASR
jgi:hypothetical protein